MYRTTRNTQTRPRTTRRPKPKLDAAQAITDEIVALLEKGDLPWRRPWRTATRAVWISKSKTLIEDARRDWSDLGGAPTDIVALDRWKPDEDVTLGRGILFVTYATLRSVGKTGRSRLEQLIDWCGADYEGVLAFDEAHAMANAAGSTDGGRGATAPSQQGIAGLRLQIALPRARMLYVSATGATNVGNLAYATRLGLWGPGDA